MKNASILVMVVTENLVIHHTSVCKFARHKHLIIEIISQEEASEASQLKGLLLSGSVLKLIVEGHNCKAWSPWRSFCCTFCLVH